MILHRSFQRCAYLQTYFLPKINTLNSNRANSQRVKHENDSEDYDSNIN